MLGLALALLACGCFATNGTMAARATYRADPIVASYLAHLAGCLTIMCLAALSGELPRVAGLDPLQIGVLFLVGLTQYVLGRSCFFLSLRTVGASRTQVIVQSNPIVSILGAIILFQEPLTPRVVVGVGCVMGGLVLITRERQ
jgi:drug/metabolite transporter (DMT)-like permease